MLDLVRRLRAGKVIRPGEVMRRETVESLVAGADEYYRNSIASGATQFLKQKPFHSFEESPQVLVRLGWLLHGARLTPGLRVAEYGGGAGWLSALLWQMGCHVTCIDASAAALTLAREVFDERRPLLMRPDATSSTALTDGHTVPLAGGSVDRVMCFDVFHHVPNQEEILREFHRVLKPGGMACFAEPGRYHSAMPASQHEMANFRVLENDIVLEDVWQLAQKAGFTGIEIRPMLDTSWALSMDDYRSLTDGGRVGIEGRDALMNGTVSYSMFVLQKGPFALDSRYPSALGASITAPASLATKAGVPVRLTAVCRNTGQGRWLSKASGDGEFGVVKLGIMRCDAGGSIVARDWKRVALPHDVLPGESVELTGELVFPDAGSEVVRVDLVSEQVAWFEAATAPIVVTVALP